MEVTYQREGSPVCRQVTKDDIWTMLYSLQQDNVSYTVILTEEELQGESVQEATVDYYEEIEI